MNREWLEDVRETMAYIKMCESKEMHNQEQADMAKCYLIERYGDWLIEQAERVSKQETRINNLTFELAVSRTQIKRYQEFINNVKTAVEQPIGLDESMVHLANEIIQYNKP